MAEHPFPTATRSKPRRDTRASPPNGAKIDHREPRPPLHAPWQKHHLERVLENENDRHKCERPRRGGPWLTQIPTDLRSMSLTNREKSPITEQINAV
jgi:hypothetical protein